MQPDKPAFYPALTGFRVIGATMVFAAHHAYIISEQNRAWLFSIGYMGFSFFFVLSGFVIIQQCHHYSFNTPAEYFKYILTRMARLFPIYWLLLAILYFKWLYSVPELLAHITLTKGYFKRFQLSGIVQSWTLTVELTFYFLVPLLLSLIRKYSLLLTYFLVLLIGVGLALLGGFLSKSGYNSFQFIPDFKNMIWFTFFGHATDFFVGMKVFYLIQEENIKGKRRHFPIKALYTGFLLMFLVYLMLVFLSEPGIPAVEIWPGLLLHNFIQPIASGLILYSLCREKTYFQMVLSAPPLIFLGNATFMFYLLHLGWVRNWFMNSISGSVLLIFGFMWVLAIIMHYALEKPIYSFLKSRVLKFN